MCSVLKLIIHDTIHLQCQFVRMQDLISRNKEEIVDQITRWMLGKMIFLPLRKPNVAGEMLYNMHLKPVICISNRSCLFWKKQI